MSTTEVSPCFDPELGPAPARPTPEEIDAYAKRHQEAKIAKIAADQSFAAIEQEGFAMVANFGTMPQTAEKSRRLAGRYAELTVTKSDTVTVIPDRVRDFEDALTVNGYGELFGRFFAAETKYSIVDGAESVLKTLQISKRLAARIFALFGRSISIRTKKPSLKVTITDPEKPKKARRAKKDDPAK